MASQVYRDDVSEALRLLDLYELSGLCTRVASESDSTR